MQKLFSMKNPHNTLLVLFILLSFQTIAQDSPPNFEPKSNKGKIYAYWGWNRGWYSNSDIHFTGDNYDFTISGVEANDRQSPLSFNTYLNPSNISIPQTNYGIGIFISEKIDISFSVDHMKYVMIENQEKSITGEIRNETEFEGSYNDDNIQLNQEFLKFEHTDGLNYINTEITYNDDLLKFFKFHPNKNKIQLNYLLGIGIGGLMPRSNVTLMGGERNDTFHWAGYGLNAKTGLDLIFYKFFFFRSEYKLGFIDMPDIKTTPHESDRASQHFWFTQLNFIFGFAFNPFN